MSLQVINGDDPRLSTELSCRVTLIGSLVVLELLALTVIACLAQFTSWLIAKPIALNPWYSILAVDFLVVVFSAGLAQYADVKQNDSDTPSFSPRASGVACFMVSIGTLAPIASYAATIWRKLAGGTDYQGTFVSVGMCSINAQSCHHMYFYLVVLLAGMSIAVAGWAARILHQISNEESGLHERWTVRSTVPLGASVFLFSAATLFHQGWDAKLSDSESLTEAGYLAIAAALLIAALCFSCLGLMATRVVGRATSDDVRQIRRGRSTIVGLSWLGAITVWGSIFWVFSVVARLVDDYTREWPIIREWLLPVVQLLGYCIVFWLVTVAVCSAIAIIYVLAWGLPRIGRAGAQVLNGVGATVLAWPERAFAFIAFLEGLSLNLLERGIKHLKEGSFIGLRWTSRPKGRHSRDMQRNPGRAAEENGGQPGKQKGDAADIGMIAGRPSGHEDGGGGGASTIEQGVVAHAWPWGRPRPSLWRQAVELASTLLNAGWQQLVQSTIDLVKATRALGRWLAPVGAVFKSFLVLLTLPPVTYSLVSPVVEQRWEIPNELEWLPQEPVAPLVPKKPILFAQAKLICPSHELLAWSRYDEDELHFSIRSCRFEEGF